MHLKCMIKHRYWRLEEYKSGSSEDKKVHFSDQFRKSKAIFAISEDKVQLEQSGWSFEFHNEDKIITSMKVTIL